MNKLEIVKIVAEETGLGLTQKEVSSVVDCFISTIIKELKKGEEVNIAGFGKFVVKNRAKRTSINPKTKEPIEVPASKAPTFRAGKQFKDAVNNK
ncbi:MAG: HU family DNA-binding protein [Clostridia bacterium]|nr:HU family DNA-binding protein [Clostridia bacterium]